MEVLCILYIESYITFKCQKTCIHVEKPPYLLEYTVAPHNIKLY